MRTTKRVVKLWSGARPEKMEAWLERMEAAGWNLVRVHWGGVKFTFEKGTPSTVRYCIDYRMESDAEHIYLLEDAGWELMLNHSGWFIWRKPYEGRKPELFTDIDSLLERNKRMLRLYGI